MSETIQTNEEGDVVIEQGSEAWQALRAGKVTCSILKHVVAVRQRGNGELAGRRDARVRAMLERLSINGLPGFDGNKATAWGKRYEPLAKQAYERITGNFITDAPFFDHPTIKGFGGSPDGIIYGDDEITIVGGVEVKCPYSGTGHIDAILSGEMPEDHWDQVQGNIAVTGAQWWDFISFDPRLPEHLQLFVRRIWRDDQYINERIVPAVTALLAEIEAGVAELLALDPAKVVYAGTDDRETWLRQRAEALAAAEAAAAEELARKQAEKDAKAAAKKEVKKAA